MSQAARYYLPEPSHWPIFGSIALLLMAFGGAMWLNHVTAGPYVVAAGGAFLIYMLFGWFGTVIRESESGKFNQQVDASFRWGMGWFIFSEVMFFASFFGALFYARIITAPMLGLRVSIRGAAASTETVSARLPSAIVALTTRLAFTCSTRPVRTNVRNPASMLSTRYGPKGRFVNVYEPFASVTVDRLNPVSV